jgi:hypothetical protein
VRVTADIYSHAIHGQDDEAVRRVGGISPAQQPEPASQGRTVVNMARTRKTLPIRMAPKPTRPIPSQEEVLGRNFASAFIATQQGIGLDYARKKHAHEPVGEFWISLARMVIDHLANQPALPPRILPRIQ